MDLGKKKQIHSLGAAFKDLPAHCTYAAKAGAFYTHVVARYSQLLERLNSRATHTYFRCDKQQSLGGVSDLFIPQARGDIFLPSI